MSNVLLATAGYDHVIRLWEPRSGVCARTLQFEGSQVNRLLIAPDKQFLLAAGNPQVKIYDVLAGTPAPISKYGGHTSNITAIGMIKGNNNKYFFSASDDKTIKIWDKTSKVFQREFKCRSPVADAVMHPNGGEIISCHRDGKIRVWDIGKGTVSKEWAPDGKVRTADTTLFAQIQFIMLVSLYFMSKCTGVRV